MTKYIEIVLDGHIDRYKLINISVDDFIDFVISTPKLGALVKDISETEYESNKKFHLEFNVDDLFDTEHYVYKHRTKEGRNEWNRFVRQQRRNEELFGEEN